MAGDSIVMAETAVEASTNGTAASVEVGTNGAATSVEMGTNGEAERALSAFDIRRANFPDEISFYAPGLKRFETSEFSQETPRAFLPISLTGSGCALKCDHCATKILDPMIPLDHSEGLFALCSRLHETGTTGILISGGSLKNGTVPILKHVDDIARVKSELGMNVMVHTGVVDEETSCQLKQAGIDGVMLDIIGDNDTIRDVYHLDLKVDDFDHSLEVLARHGHSMRPHIILGLNYGRFIGEYNALEMIAHYPVHALVLVILTPLGGTPMVNVTPPSPGEIGRFFEAARRTMPDTLIMLGCARPAGAHKAAVDRLAVEHGLNGIAYPAEGIIEHAAELGLRGQFHEHACSCGC